MHGYKLLTFLVKKVTRDSCRLDADALRMLLRSKKKKK